MPASETPGWERFLPNQSEETVSPLVSGHAGQSVLVTGAGGYIGSALARAIAQSGPRSLIVLDSSEHNLFEVKRNVEPHAAFLGTVEDTNLLDHVFSRFHPEVVYHAAAFKHVPLLELNPIAAVRNNVLGTYALARAAIRHEASSLLLISTDKAVNPHSIMGVSKRIAELTIVALSTPACRMNAIRLGNVIGSPGSVVPLFVDQIAACKPVTVTHPDATRWFLTLRQTVEAILASGKGCCEGRILMPELGEPVRIVELARFLIRAAAKENPIEYTGLRPGDKLSEESIFATEFKANEIKEGCEVKTCKLALDRLEEVITGLSRCIEGRDVARLIQLLRSVVPEYVPSRLLQ